MNNNPKYLCIVKLESTKGSRVLYSKNILVDIFRPDTLLLIDRVVEKILEDNANRLYLAKKAANVIFRVFVDNMVVSADSVFDLSAMQKDVNNICSVVAEDLERYALQKNAHPEEN